MRKVVAFGGLVIGLLCARSQADQLPREVNFFDSPEDFKTAIFSTDIKNGYRGWFQSKAYVYPLPVYGALYRLRLRNVTLVSENSECDKDFLNQFMVNDSGYEADYADQLFPSEAPSILEVLYLGSKRTDNYYDPDKEGQALVNKYLNLVAQYMITNDCFVGSPSVPIYAYDFDSTLQSPMASDLQPLVDELLRRKNILEIPNKVFKGTLFDVLKYPINNLKEDAQKKKDEEDQKKQDEVKKLKEKEELEKKVEQEKKKKEEEEKKKLEKEPQKPEIKQPPLPQQPLSDGNDDGLEDDTAQVESAHENVDGEEDLEEQLYLLAASLKTISFSRGRGVQ